MQSSKILGIVLSFAGVIDSAYLSVESLTNSLPPFCTQGTFNCIPVLTSGYSRLFGIPVAFLGLVWFLTMFILFSRKELSTFSFPLWVAGVLFVLYLIYVEIFVIHSVCPYCSVAHVLCFLLGVPIINKLFSE